MKIVYRYRETIEMNKVNNWKKLTSTYSGSDTELSSLAEDETSCTKQNACIDELTSVIIKKQSEKQNVCNEEKQHCSDNFAYCGENEKQSDLRLNQQVPTIRSTLETKDLLSDLQQILIESQDYIQDDLKTSLTISNDGNLIEYLQEFNIEQVPEIQGKTTSKVSDNQMIKDMITLNKEFQISLSRLTIFL